jgi:aspartate aminotransferase
MIGDVSPDIEALLLPQERFDELYQLSCRRAAGDLCDLAYANAYDGPDSKVIMVIKEALESEGTLSFQYTPYGGSTITRRLIANHLCETHSAAFCWRDVILTPGAMAALNVVFRSLKTSGRDEVLVLTPCWMDYPLYLVQLGLIPIFVPLKADTFRLDLDSIEEAITSNTRAIVFSQPANPTGILYGDDELARLAQLLRTRCKKRQSPLIISDECHRDFVYPPHSFVSPSRHYDSTIIIYSFGKALLMQGQRIGYVAVSPRFPAREHYRRMLERNCRMMGFCTPTALMQLAIRRLLAHHANLIVLRRRRDQIVTSLLMTGYSVVPSQATFFIYISCPEPDDFAFATRLADKGVLVMPGSLFHNRGHFRICVTASDEMVDRALPVLKSAFKA